MTTRRNDFVKRAVLIAVGCALLTAAYLGASARPTTPGVMTSSAKAFLASLDSGQKAKASFGFADEQRFDWHFIPRERKGLPLREMNSAQKLLAHGLLASGLSQQGYIKATTIMSLDQVLKEIEVDAQGKPTGPYRDPEGYFFSVFGEPSEAGTWAFRFEGHHISINFTVTGGKVIASPNFYGANPAEVRVGPRAGLRALAREEDLARDFLATLTPELKKIAIVDPVAPKDILSFNSRKASLDVVNKDGKPVGLLVSKLNPKQRAAFDELVRVYATNFPESVAMERLAKVKAAGAQLWFAWAGTEERGGPHYYRIQALKFLIEYDNTQNNANHIHAVWRDFEGDFGMDVLAEHYKASHTPASK